MENKNWHLPHSILKRLSAFWGRNLYTHTQPDAAKKSLFIRHVDGGSSNIFELELLTLTNPVYDLAQYGLHFVASPRHADILLLTGPLTWSMLGPVQEAFAAMPLPRWIVTMGQFAGFASLDQETDPFFLTSYATTRLPDELQKAVVAHIPGDPPRPDAIVKTLLALRK
jgi:Ni,Fe-hydrogenase III small subunit